MSFQVVAPSQSGFAGHSGSFRGACTASSGAPAGLALLLAGLLAGGLFAGPVALFAGDEPPAGDARKAEKANEDELVVPGRLAVTGAAGRERIVLSTRDDRAAIELRDAGGPERTREVSGYLRSTLGPPAVSVTL